MFLQLSAVIVDADSANCAELANVLRSHGLSVHHQLTDIESLASYLPRSEAPQVVLINLDPTATATLEKLGNLPRQFPHVAFFALSQVLDPTLLMRSMALGVREFIPLPMTEQTLVEALERVAQSHGEGKRALTIHVIPSVGGVGSTTIACNVAASLAVQGHKTCLIDLDLVRGGVASQFDLRPTYTIADVLGSEERADQQLVENALIHHEGSGLAILARPELPEESQRVTKAGVATLLNTLDRMFDCVVIDSVMSIDPVYAAAVGCADINLLVMQLNIPAAKNTERFVGALRRMGIESAKTRVLVNRYARKGWDLEPAEVERALGLRISWMVPNDYKNAISAINYGEPVVLRSPRAEMSRALRAFAAELHVGQARRAA